MPWGKVKKKCFLNIAQQLLTIINNIIIILVLYAHLRNALSRNVHTGLPGTLSGAQSRG